MSHQFHPFPSCQERVSEGACDNGCGPGVELLKVEANLCPLSVVLADGSSAAISSGKERALVVVEEEGQEERDSEMGRLGFGAESVEAWNSSCLAQFSNFLSMPTKG